MTFISVAEFLLYAVPIVFGLMCLLATVGIYLDRLDHVPDFQLEPPIYRNGHEIIAAGTLDRGRFQLIQTPAAGYTALLTRVVFDVHGEVTSADSITLDCSTWGFVNIGTYKSRVIRIKCGMGHQVAWFDTPRVIF